MHGCTQKPGYIHRSAAARRGCTVGSDHGVQSRRSWSVLCGIGWQRGVAGDVFRGRDGHVLAFDLDTGVPCLECSLHQAVLRKWALACVKFFLTSSESE